MLDRHKTHTAGGPTYASVTGATFTADRRAKLSPRHAEDAKFLICGDKEPVFERAGFLEGPFHKVCELHDDAVMSSMASKPGLDRNDSASEESESNAEASSEKRFLSKSGKLTCVSRRPIY